MSAKLNPLDPALTKQNVFPKKDKQEEDALETKFSVLKNFSVQFPITSSDGSALNVILDDKTKAVFGEALELLLTQSKYVSKRFNLSTLVDFAFAINKKVKANESIDIDAVAATLSKVVTHNGMTAALTKACPQLSGVLLVGEIAEKLKTYTPEGTFLHNTLSTAGASAETVEIFSEKLSRDIMNTSVSLEGGKVTFSMGDKSVSIGTMQELDQSEIAVRSVIDNIENNEQSSQRGLTDLIFGASVALVKSGAELLLNRSLMQETSSDVKSFTKRYEEKKAQLNEPVPLDNPTQLSDELSTFLREIQNPARVAYSYEELKRAGQEFFAAQKELRKAKLASQSEKGTLHQDLKSLDAKDKKTQSSLEKAIRKKQAVDRKLGVFRSILNVAGAVLSAIPGPTQIAGASLLTATNTAGAFIGRNNDKRFSKRVNKNQKRLDESLTQRTRIKDRLAFIDRSVLEVEKSQQSIDAWILSDDSKGCLLVEDRLKQLQRVVTQNQQRVATIQGQISSKDKAIKAKDKEWNKREAILNNYRGIPGLKTKHELREQFSDFNNKLKIQDECGKVLKQLKKEKKTLVQALLPQARTELESSTKTFEREIELKPLSQHDQLLDFERNSFENRFTPRQQLWVTNMQKFAILQTQKQAAFANTLGGGGELAFSIYALTGSPFLYHCYSGAHYAFQCSSMKERLEKAYELWPAFWTNPNGQIRKWNIPEFGDENFLNTLVAPVIRCLAAGLGVFGAGYNISSTIVSLFIAPKKPEIKKSELQVMYEFMQQDLQYAAEGIQTLISESHKDLSSTMDKMRSELGTLGKELLSTLKMHQEELQEEFKEDRFTEHLKEINEKVLKISRKGIEFRNSAEIDEKSWFDFLGMLKSQLLTCRSPELNGYAFLNTLASEMNRPWKPLVDITQIYQKPAAYSGLIGKQVIKDKSLCNLSILGIVCEELAASTSSLDLPSENVTIEVKKLEAEIKRAVNEFEALFVQIPSLIRELHRQQQKFLEKLDQNKLFWIEQRKKHSKAVKQQVASYIHFGKKGLLSQGRFFLYHEIADKTFAEILSRYDFDAIASKHHNTSEPSSEPLSVASKALNLSISLFTTPAGWFADALSYAYESLGSLERQRPGAQLLGVVQNSLLKDLIKEPLKAGSNEKPPREKKILGIDLCKKEIVEIQEKEKNSSAFPLIGLDLSFIFCRFNHHQEQLRVSLDPRSLINLSELVHLTENPPSREYHDSLSLKAKNYRKLLKAYVEGRAATTEFTKQLGEHEILLSTNPSQIPLAFPKELLKECQQHLAIELAFAERCNIGTFIPEYEFLADKGTLSITYRFFSSQDPKPYCKFEIARFDQKTLGSFSKISVNGQQQISLHLEDASEFLLQLMYAGIDESEDLPTMPGDLTLKLKSGLVAPVDRPFVGLYKILKKAPNLILNFNCETYTDSQQAQLKDWLNEEDCLPPSDLIQNSYGPRFAPEFLEIWNKLLENKKAYTKSTSYERNYYQLIGILKLFSACENAYLKEALSRFLICTPEELDFLIKSSEFVNYSSATIDEVEIEQFLSTIKDQPSPDLLKLFSLISPDSLHDTHSADGSTKK